MDKNSYEEQTFSGSVEEIVYYNDENCYCVCDIDAKGELITAVGTMPYISPGETVTLTGRFTIHHTYGKQFSVSEFVKTPPNSEDSIYKYLASGLIKGIRAVTAKKIVDKFGCEALNIIENEPEKLAEIKGISVKMAFEINDRYLKQFGMRNIAMFLQDSGISVSFAKKIYEKYGSRAIDKIKENPYILARDISGIGFKTADKLALSLGCPHDDIERIKAAVLYLLNEYAMSSGNTYCPDGLMVAKTISLIECREDVVRNALTELAIEKSIVSERKNDYDAIYLVPLHVAEISVAHRMKKLNETYPSAVTPALEEIISNVEKMTGITLAQNQRKAVMSALTCPVLVITGGPGTGKTTVINTIIHAMELQARKVVLAAPTGRAAKRMSEVSGREAKTLHRLLETGYQDGSDKMQFARNESNPIDADVIIVDEMSMVDIMLFNSLLRAVKDSTTLILVGDSDQLPSVGPGNVLRDIINSGGIIVERLTEIFRQEEQSMIVINAHRINKGLFPKLNIKGKDFFFMNRDSVEGITSTIAELCKDRLPNAYGYNPLTDIQVLTPMRKNAVGVNALNETLQKILNPPSPDKEEKTFGDVTFRVGDKVMQIRNNYDIEWSQNGKEGQGLFNGDLGIITEIDNDYEYMTIIFDDDKETEYDFASLADIEPAYATTVHKSQGSEFPVVIMPMFQGSPVIMYRNLLYTAVTRAKKLVVLVGNQNVLAGMIKNNNEIKRYSGLKDRLSYD